jgi:hypothetical protein
VLSERNVKLVITVDCGITSIEPVNRAIERGIDVIITDHHLPPGTLPEAAAVLNPKQPGCEYPFKDLAGVGVVFKLCCELLRRNKKKMSVESLLKIAAIGTIADVAPLIGENRTIAHPASTASAIRATTASVRSSAVSASSAGRCAQATSVSKSARASTPPGGWRRRTPRSSSSRRRPKSRRRISARSSTA